MLVFVVSGCTKSEYKTDEPVASLEKAYRAFHEGLSSADKEERLRALEAITWTKEDIVALFPRDFERVWKVLGPLRKEWLDHCNEIADEFAGDGPISWLEATDVRAKDKNYTKVLAMMPDDVPLYSLYVACQKGGGRFETYIFVRNRWIIIPKLPELLKKLDEDGR
jgi:hypothetical protein